MSRKTLAELCAERKAARAGLAPPRATGYTLGNCRLVSAAVNVALNSWGETVLERIAEGIVAQRLRQVEGYMAKLSEMNRKIKRKNRYLRR